MGTGRYLASVKRQLPIDAQADLDRALAGDALAARRLVLASPKRFLGHIAFLAYQRKTKNPAYRELLKAVWQPKARSLLTAFWRPQVVRKMLARAEFERPALFGPVTVFRAVETSVRAAGAELCWTLSRNDAISEALGADPSNPRIIQAVVAPTDVLVFEKSGEEVVTRTPPKAVVVEAVGRRKGIKTAGANDAGTRRSAGRL